MASMRSASSRTGKREPFSGGKRALSLANFVAYPSEGAFLTGQLFGPCTMNGGLFGSETPLMWSSGCGADPTSGLASLSMR